MLNTDPAAGELRDNLSYIYGLYVEYVMKNPLYVPGQPFRCIYWPSLHSINGVGSPSVAILYAAQCSASLLIADCLCMQMRAVLQATVPVREEHWFVTVCLLESIRVDCHTTSLHIDGQIDEPMSPMQQ